MPLSIEIYVLCNILAMCMDVTETYDDMMGLRLILYMCKAEKTHLVDRVEIRGYEFNEQLQTYYKSKELTFVDFFKEV